MTCDESLDRILEADPAELRGEADTELGRHVAGCARCAAVAATLREELDAVDAALERYATDPAAAERAADAALRASREERTPARRRYRWTPAAWVPLAAAAVLAAVLLGRDGGPLPTGVPAPEPRIEPRVSVTPPTDRNAAIMETENPNITIVWLYEREGT